MAKGIAKTIRKLPNTTECAYYERFETNKHKKKKKAAPVANTYSNEALEIMGYSKQEIQYKKIIWG